jgi:hypothetical protein
LAAFGCLVGYQLIVFALFTKLFAITHGLHPPVNWLRKLSSYVTLELGLLAGLVLTGMGLASLVMAILGWKNVEFSALDPRVTMRQVIPAVLFLILGLQTVFSSFFLSILTMRQRGNIEK